MLIGDDLQIKSNILFTNVKILKINEQTDSIVIQSEKFMFCGTSSITDLLFSSEADMQYSPHPLCYRISNILEYVK